MNEGLYRIIDQDINTVDVRSLTPESETPVNYYNPNGTIDTAPFCVVYQFFMAEQKMNHWRLAKNSRVFEDGFDNDLNPGIDINNLKNDSSQTIIWNSLNDKTVTDSVCNIIFAIQHPGVPGSKRILRPMVYSEIPGLYAKDVPEFMEGFHEEYNPGIDIDELKCSSDATVIWIAPNKRPVMYSVSSIIHAIDHPESRCSNNVLRPDIVKYGEPAAADHLAVNIPGFVDRFIPELNPDININNLPMGSKADIYWKNQEGKILRSNVLSITSVLRKKAKDHTLYAKDVIPDIKNIIKQRLNDVIIDYDNLTAESHMKVYYKMPYDDDLYYDEVARIAIRFQRRGSLKRKRYRSALNANPDIARFWKDKAFYPDELSASSSRPVTFECPYCKTVFHKTVASMISSNLRCPNCDDAQENDLPLDTDTGSYSYEPYVNSFRSKTRSRGAFGTCAALIAVGIITIIILIILLFFL